MKRLHVHVSVDDLQHAIDFYSTLFGAEPKVTRPDYAKWMLDDPRVNFAISSRGRKVGLDHLGIEAENGEELKEAYARLRATGAAVLEQGETTCCYAQSEKSWIADPAGLLWETFYTTGESAVYGEGLDPASIGNMSACCGSRPAEKHVDPSNAGASRCCSK